MSTHYRNTVVGSYPRPLAVADTMKRPTLSEAEIDDLVLWAAKDQAALGLDTIGDGESYRENMYYYYQKRIDGITFEDTLLLNSLGLILCALLYRVSHVVRWFLLFGMKELCQFRKRFKKRFKKRPRIVSN